MNERNNKKAWYKKWWIWVIIIIVLIAIGSGATGNNGIPQSTQDKNIKTEQPAAEPEPTKAKWDVDTEYSKINDGMTKAEVESAIGKTSDNCSETSAEYIGKIESCNYGGVGDNGMIMVQYQNDKLTTKTKSKF